MTQRLSGKVIVVIGGTAGLGLSAAKQCVAEGAFVVVVGRDAEKLEQVIGLLNQAHEVARGYAGDAMDPQTAPRAIALAVKSFGRLDGLYHVAGGSGRSRGDGPLHTVTDEGWDYTLGLNQNSAFYSNRAAINQFLSQQSGGVILNMASVLAQNPAPSFFASHAYGTSKAAVIGMSRAAAAYYARFNIRINVLAPALVATALSERAQSNEPLMEYVKYKQPLDQGRIGTVEDIDGAVVFLLSDESKFMTGQVVTVDGGFSLSEGYMETDQTDYSTGR